MELIEKAFLKKALVVLTLFFITACTHPQLTPTEQITHAPVSSSCSWPPTQISDMALSSFHWSRNDEAITYQQEGNSSTWFRYDLFSGKTVETEVDPSPTETPKNGLDDWGIESYYDLFISPDRRYAIYTQPTDQQTLDVYLKMTKEKPPTFLGNIKGLIDQHIWIHEGRQIIFSIDWQSRWGAGEASVYLVNVLDAKIKVLLPNSVKDGNNTLYNITLLGITPKEDTLLFVNYSGQDRLLRLFDIQNGSISLTEVHAPFTLRWLPSGDQFWAIGYKTDGSLDFESYIYNINDHSTRYVVPAPIKLPNVVKSVVISPDLKSIIFIERTNDKLYKIDCSHVVPSKQ